MPKSSNPPEGTLPEQASSLLQGIPAELPEELMETLLDGREFRVERIVSRGHASPPGFWYDQEEHEWVLLLQGGARLRFEDGGREVSLTAGDCLNIPAHCRHRVEWTDAEGDSIWLAIFYR